MAATFVVEDGTGLTNSNSYLSEANADLYFENHTDPVAWTGATTAAKEEALRMATQFLDSTYGARWRGRRVSQDQALDWPRVNVVDDDDWWIDSDAIPQDLADATAEMALRHITEVASSSTLVPDLSKPGGIKSEYARVGELESRTVYSGSRGQLKSFTLVERLLRSLLVPAGKAWLG